MSAWGPQSDPQELSWSRSSVLNIAAFAPLSQQVGFSLKVHGSRWMNVSCPAHTAGSLQSLSFVSPWKETLGVSLCSTLACSHLLMPHGRNLGAGSAGGVRSIATRLVRCSAESRQLHLLRTLLSTV